MRTLLAYLPLLGCLAVMVVCIRMMSHGKHEESGGEEASRLRDEIAELREEVARLRGQAAEREDVRG